MSVLNLSLLDYICSGVVVFLLSHRAAQICFIREIVLKYTLHAIEILAGTLFICLLSALAYDKY